MLGWLVDNFGLVTFVLGAIAVGCFAYAWSTGRGRYYAIGLVPVALIAIVWLAGRFFLTDSQRIVRDLDEMAHGVETGNFDEVLRHVSKEFKTDALSAADLAGRIKGTLKGMKVDIRLWNQTVEVKGNSAEAYFNFKVDGDGGTYAASAKGLFIREDGEWKLNGLKTYSLGTLEPMHIPGVN
jgi:hypothetical protein